MTLKVLRVLDSAESTVMLGTKVYNIKTDRKALLKELSGGCYVATPMVAVTEAQGMTLFQWLMHAKVDMSKVYVIQFSRAGGFITASRLIKVRPKDRPVPAEVELSADETEFAAFIRNVLLGLYKVYYAQESAAYAKTLDDVKVKQQRLLAEFNLLANTDYTSLTDYTLAELRRAGVAKDLYEELRQVYKKYKRLRMYIQTGPEAVLRLLASKHLCIWTSALQIDKLVAGASAGRLNPRKYYSVTLSGLFCEVRYATGQTANAYLSSVLGVTGVDCTMGMSELRKQSADVRDIVVKYYQEMNKVEKQGGFSDYSYALVKLINEVIELTESAGYKAYIVDIGGSVGFAFSNSTPVSVSSKSLRTALQNNPSVAWLFDSVCVGDKPNVPMAGLYQEKAWKEEKSRDCASDFYDCLLK